MDSCHPIGSDSHPDNGVDGREDRSLPTSSSRFHELVRDFDPMWLTWCMNSGMLGILLHQYSYQFHGLAVLADIAFIIDLTLFIIISFLLVLRLVWFRRRAYNEIVDNMASLAMLAAWPISWLTLVALVVLTISNSYWGGHGWTMLAYVMWWIGAAWMIATLYFVLLNVMNRHSKRPGTHLNPLLLVPTVGVATVGTIGGLLSTFSNSLTPSEAVPVILFSFCAEGVALFMAIFLYAYIFHQLLTDGLPSPVELGLMFVLVGPMGQSATALQMLGSAANTYGKFAGVDQGTFITSTSAASLDTACVLIALMLSGMGSIWLLFAFIAFSDRAVHSKLVWSPSWNVIIFPTGTLTTSFLELAIELNSPFFRVMSGIVIVFLVIIYFVNMMFTIWKIARGELLIQKQPGG